MKFAQPEYAVFLLLPFLLVFFFYNTGQKNRRALELLVSKETWLQVVDFSGQGRRRIEWTLRVAAVVCMVLALLGPQWGYEWREVKVEGREIIFALDTSKSMLAVDVKPNRLERAKLAVKDLVTMVKGDKVGLIAFAGGSFLQCPLTLDYNAFVIALDALDVYSIPRGGTAVGEAIAVAQKAFQNSAGGKKILILITDGENHEGDPVAAAKRAQADGMIIYTVGLGSPEGELILIEDEKGNPSYLKDAAGQAVKSALNERVLREIAAAGNGLYLRGSGSSLGLDTLYQNELSKFKATELKSRLQKSYINRYQLPLFLALLLFTIEALLGTGGKRQAKPPSVHRKGQSGGEAML